MRNDSALSRLFLSAAIAVSGIAPLSATPSISSLRPAGPARVTIRGNGNAVSVERGEAAAVVGTDAEEPSSVLEEAIRMKESGAGDDALVQYLRVHRAEIPPYVDLGAVSALQDAGAGRSVVAYLSIVSAVEIGPTGAVGGVHEGPEPEYGHSPEELMTNELPADLAWGGWGWGGGLANGDFGRSRRRDHGPIRGFPKRPGGGLGSAMPRPTPHPTAPAAGAARLRPWR
jgi:hypothetical protein